MKKLFISLGIVLFVTAFISCRSTKATMPVDVLTSGTWELSTLNGTTVQASDFGRSLPYISFSTDNKVTGNGGCNTFSGSYNLNDEGGINISQVIATKMYCEGKEPEFFTALNNANMTKAVDDKLVLLNGMKEVMTFIRKK